MLYSLPVFVAALFLQVFFAISSRYGVRTAVVWHEKR